MNDENLFYYWYYKWQAIHRKKKSLFSALQEQACATHAESGSDLCPDGTEQ